MCVGCPPCIGLGCQILRLLSSSIKLNNSWLVTVSSRPWMCQTRETGGVCGWHDVRPVAFPLWGSFNIHQPPNKLMSRPYAMGMMGHVQGVAAAQRSEKMLQNMYSKDIDQAAFAVKEPPPVTPHPPCEFERPADLVI